MANDDLKKLDIAQITEIVKAELPDVLSALDTSPKAYLKSLIMAMGTLNTIEDNYYLDSGLEVVAKFVDSSRAWNSETGKLVRAELERRVEDHNKYLSKLNDQGGQTLL